MTALVLNLGALGVTEEALTSAILSELGMTKEQAVKALAEKLGVSLEQPQAKVESFSIQSGDTVQTSEGAAKAFILKGTDAAALANAVRILSSLSGNGKAN